MTPVLGGNDVELVHDGDQALEAISRSRVDIAVLDNAARQRPRRRTARAGHRQRNHADPDA
jgi:DNA-binding response OmpR family regulator